MFGVVFGVPLSFATLITGATLGISSRWGVLRYPWTTAKLLLIVSVVLVGALVIDGALTTMLDGRGGAETRLIAAATWDVLALTTATRARRLQARPTPQPTARTRPLPTGLTARRSDAMSITPPNVLLRSEQSAGAVSAIEVTSPAGFKGPPLHHHGFDEAFYVLEGELTFQLRDDVFTRRAGSSRSRHATCRTPTRTTATLRRER
jgi:mannose-6-phosphate isomerase-like protein (cupin superfamily)